MGLWPINSGSKQDFSKCGVTLAHRPLCLNGFLYCWCLYHPTSKNFVPPQQKLLVFPTPTLELQSNAFPSAVTAMSGTESVFLGQERKNFALSEREELVRHLLAGSEDEVLKRDALQKAAEKYGCHWQTIERVRIRRWVRSSKMPAMSPTRG